MATLTEWPLPTIPLPPEVNGKANVWFLTQWQEGLLYYTRSSLGNDVLGELKTQNNTVREWPVPSALSGGAAIATASGVTLGLRGEVWLALSNANRIVAFDPASGAFTAYYSPGKPPGPFFYPRTIRVEASGVVWFTAMWTDKSMGAYGTAIGRLDPSRRSAWLWRLPIGIYAAEGFWIESSTTVWFSTYYRFAQADFCLCRLDVSANPAANPARLDYWRPSGPPAPSFGGSPSYPRGVVGDARGGRLRDIWFAYDLPTAVYPQVGRFNVPSGQFFEFVPTVPAAPLKLSLDSRGFLWIGHGCDKVSVIAPAANCGRTKFNQSTDNVKPDQIKIAHTPATATPTPATLVSANPSVGFVPDNCYKHIKLPSTSASSWDLSLSVGTAWPPRVFFTEVSLNRIGELDLDPIEMPP